MQKVWFVTMFVFTVAFFLFFFVVYFFRPKKEDKITPLPRERELLDFELISLPHRAEPNWPVTIETTTGKTSQASITSITHGSAFIKSATKLEIGEKFKITIHLPGQTPMQLKADVIWSNMNLPAEKVLNRGMGIRFIGAGEDTVRLINDTISQHAAGLHTTGSPAAK